MFIVIRDVIYLLFIVLSLKISGARNGREGRVSIQLVNSFACGFVPILYIFKIEGQLSLNDSAPQSLNIRSGIGNITFFWRKDWIVQSNTILTFPPIPYCS